MKSLGRITSTILHNAFRLAQEKKLSVLALVRLSHGLSPFGFMCYVWPPISYFGLFHLLPPLIMESWTDRLPLDNHVEPGTYNAILQHIAARPPIRFART